VKLSDDDDKDFERVQMIVNSTVKSPSKKKSVKQKKISSDHQLSEKQRDALKQKQLNDLRDVLRLLCLDKGCQHRRLAHYLHCGSLDKYTVDLGSCGGTCAICATDRKKDMWCNNFMPVSRYGLSIFFRRETNICQEATYDNLIKLVWDNETWIEQIFDKKKGTINKYNVEAMLLQLIAADILDARRYRGIFKWTLARESNSATSPFNYEKESVWCGINLISEQKRKYKLLV